MIVAKAPMRISFVGGGTDLPDFYRRTPGRVVSGTIDKYVYVAVNRTPLIDKVSARYSVSETVGHPTELQHTRIRAALLDLGIDKNIEIASFASLPVKTGLGSSSSFTVALLKALHAFWGKRIDKKGVAEAASRLEIELIGEPIGKQDQYAASFGGFNIFQFNQDDSVDIKPIFMDFRKQHDLERRLLLFFTGITRAASSILAEQKANIDNKFEVLKKMSESAVNFSHRLHEGDFEGMGGMLHEAWFSKRSLASNVSSPLIDKLYDAGINAGAWGGKVVGAGGGGCVMFLASPDKHDAIRQAVSSVAKAENLPEFKEIPVKFVHSGAEIVFNGDELHANVA